MIKQLVAVALIFNTTIAFADDVVYLKKGDASPTDGYLFSNAKAQDTRNKLLTIDDLKAMNTSYQHSIDLYKNNETIYQKQLDLLSTQNTKLVSSEQQTLSMTTYEKMAWFGFGVLVTGLAVYGAKETLFNR